MLEVKQITDPTPEQIADILNLFKEIKGRTCSAVNYLEYLNQNWENIGIFAAVDDGRIIGFTQAVKPTLLEPKVGWLPFSSLDNHKAGHKTAQEALRLAFDWLRGFGATSVRMTSVRSPRALIRAFGWQLASERLFEKEL